MDKKKLRLDVKVKNVFKKELYLNIDNFQKKKKNIAQWGSPTIFTLIGGACVPSVITFGTPRLASIT